MHFEYGYACCSCNQECSGLGQCDDCFGALCFLCAESDNMCQKGAKYYCPGCFKKKSTDNKQSQKT